MTSPQTVSPSPRLSGKVALVTGGGTGIGAAAALAFARERASVVLAGRREAELDKVANRIRSGGGSAEVIPTDVTEEDQVRSLVDRTAEKYGRLDIAFNNAGTLGAIKPITELTVDDYDAVMAVNTRAVWLLMKYEVAAMRRAGGGAIVNTTSFVAEAATPGMSIYAASKEALVAMVRAVALEVGVDGIRVNNVAPGVVRTPMSAGLDDATYAALAGHAALKRLGEPEDIADVAVWLSTEEARFITGQTVFADGGFAIPGLR